jgi:hypothetical protein
MLLASVVVFFSLGLGGVPGEGPVAGQLRGTPLCAGLTHLTLCVPVDDDDVFYKVTSIREVHTSRPGGAENHKDRKFLKDVCT